MGYKVQTRGTPLPGVPVDKHHHRKKISWSAQWWGRWWWGGSQWWGLSYNVSSRLHITASIQPSDCCLHSWGESGQEIDNVQRQQRLLPKVNISNWDLHPPSIFPPFAFDQPTNQEVEAINMVLVLAFRKNYGITWDFSLTWERGGFPIPKTFVMNGS